MSRFIHCVGIQKSGTTLLDSLVKKTGLVCCPFPSEGEHFWGQVPWHSPTAYPAGSLYQYYKGTKGHVLDEVDALPQVVSDLNKVFDTKIKTDLDFIYNKHPTNTVRIPWVKAIFPEVFVISTVRHPVANVFSIYKRFQGGNNYAENGWWGTKPANWKRIMGTDKLVQSARLWDSVNKKLLKDIDMVELVIPYHDMCERPHFWLSKMLSKASGEEYDMSGLELPELKCFDNEYSTGSRLQSKNDYIYKYGKIDIPEDKKIELSGLSDEQVDVIMDICGDTYAKLLEVSENLL